MSHERRRGILRRHDRLTRPIALAGGESMRQIVPALARDSARSVSRSALLVSDLPVARPKTRSWHSNRSSATRAAFPSFHLRCLGRSDQRDLALDRDSESLRAAISDRRRRYRRVPGPLAEQPRQPGTAERGRGGRPRRSAPTWSRSATSTSSRGRIAPWSRRLTTVCFPNNAVVTTVDPGFNRFMNAWDYAGQNQLYGWAYPTGCRQQRQSRFACTSSARSSSAIPLQVEHAGQQLRDRRGR